MDCNRPGSSVQARILEWVAISFSSPGHWQLDSLPLSHWGIPICFIHSINSMYVSIPISQSFGIKISSFPSEGLRLLGGGVERDPSIHPFIHLIHKQLHYVRPAVEPWGKMMRKPIEFLFSWILQSDKGDRH